MQVNKVTRHAGLAPTTYTPTHDQLMQGKHRRLLALEHRYAEHVKTFDSNDMDYGAHDPLECDRWINACAACNAAPHVAQESGLWVVTCPCGATTGGNHHRWRAIMTWNQSRHAAHPVWDQVPFFFLSGLDTEAGREKLQRLREHLDLRVGMEGLRFEVGLEVGRNYLQRLKAYQAWCYYALALLNRAAPRKVRPSKQDASVSG